LAHVTSRFLQRGGGAGAGDAGSQHHDRDRGAITRSVRRAVS
jgi:hypothetical protein